MSTDDSTSTSMRSAVQKYLATLTPEQAQALRARFRLDTRELTIDDEERALRALAGELALFKKAKS